MRFYYIYKSLAHPETNGYVAPYSQSERLMHVKEAEQQLGSRFTWLCDSIENELKHALGDAPNSEFVVDPDGTIVVSRPWSSPKDLRNDLARLVGEVTPQTTVAEVNMQPLAPPKTAPKGVVPRLKVPGGMSAIQVEPLTRDDETPYYVKLRAEADADALRGEGKLYLGFFLDPLYKVHWNNNSDPIFLEVDSTDGLTSAQDSAEGPKVDVSADADPREFLFDVSGEAGGSLTLSVYYFACDDAETFCKPVRQQYRVTLVRDRDGGSRRTPRAGNRPTNPDRTRQMAMMMRMFPLHRALDADGDGEISADELNRAPGAIRRLDRNKDGSVSGDELMPSRFGPGPGQNRGQNPGQRPLRRER